MTGKPKSEGAATKAAPFVPAPSFMRGTAEALDLTAPAGGVQPHRFYLIGSLVAYSTVSAVAGTRFAGILSGRFESAPKRKGEAWNEGEPLYFDGETFTPVKTATAQPVAHALSVTADKATAGLIRLRN